MIRIRTSMRGDENGVAKVAASATATLRQTYRPNQKALAHKKWISGDLHRLVAELDGQIVGTARYYVDGDAIRIIGLGVDSDFRRLGVARALVNRIADLARRRGLAAVVTRTVVQTGNVPIFEALGFQVVSEHPDDYSISEDGRTLTEADLQMEIT